MSAPIIAVDFDGVLTRADGWPKIGEFDPEMIIALVFAQRKGWRLILWTCREGEYLSAAIDWCAKRFLHFDFHNVNAPDRVAKFGSDCRKISADIILDDKSICWDRDAALAKLRALPDMRDDETGQTYKCW